MTSIVQIALATTIVIFVITSSSLPVALPRRRPERPDRRPESGWRD
jgi:hypothetical protein